MSKSASKKEQKGSNLADVLPNLALPAFFTNYRLQTLLIFSLAIFMYSGSLGHQFVQDDAIVITDNQFTQQGLSGIKGILTKDTFFGFFKVEGKDLLVSGGRYRPFTLVLFAILYEMVGADPFVFHLFTVLLFAATCLVVYHTFRYLLETELGESAAALISWIAALLFVVHPIHTEVVANIKGSDEIVTLMGSMGTLWLTLKAFDTGRSSWAWLGALVFFLACMSKENAVTFLAVIPLALWYFRRAEWSRILPLMLPLVLGFIVFFIIRGSILNWKFGGAPLELMNNPYVKWTGSGWAFYSFGEKLATIFFTLGKYVWLLFFPHPLTHDYYPNQIPIQHFSDPAVWLSLLLYIGIAYYAFRQRHQQRIISFGIFYYLLTLSIVSNLVFPVGTHMGERFVFMPSVGFVLVVAAGLVGLLQRKGGWNTGALAMTLGLSGLLGAGYALKTFMRVPAWESNERLFFTDVKTSVNSAKIRNACGGILFDKARVETDEVQRKAYCQQALPHLDKAIDIFKDYADAYITRGGCHLLLGNYEQSVADYQFALQKQPQNAKLKQSLAMALRETGKYYGEKKGDLANAQKYLQQAWQNDPTDIETARLLGVANGVAQNHQEAIKWFSKAVELDPSNASNLFDLGTAYRMGGDIQRSQEMYAKAQALDPEILQKKGKTK